MSKGQHGPSDPILETLTTGTTCDEPGRQVLGRRQRRAEETRLRLFRSALQLFADRGFSNVTVEDITEAADVGKGTFFNYFESKDHVLGVMAEVQLARVQEAVRWAASGRHSIHATLHHLFARLAEEPGRSPFLARALVASFLASEVVRDLIKHQMRDGRSMMAEMILQGQQRGEVDPSLNGDEVSFQLQQAILGTMLLWSLDGEPELNVWIEHSFQHFWRAIAAPGWEKKP